MFRNTQESEVAKVTGVPRTQECCPKAKRNVQNTKASEVVRVTWVPKTHECCTKAKCNVQKRTGKLGGKGDWCA